MTEGSLPNDSTGEGYDSTGDAVESHALPTVEEVEAIWKNRLSGKDRAHNAETAALKAQIEVLKAAPARPVEGESPEAGRVRELEAALAAERNARQVEAMRNQYPLVSSILGDAALNVPPEKLAALEASYDNGGGRSGGPMIDPNAAPRRGTGVQAASQKPLNQKSKDELLADLRKLAPAYQQAARDGLV
jgi:hypothetical protein